MSFTETLHAEFDPMVDAILDHPMVQALGDGTLDEEPFRYWVRQDYVYLIEYSRLFAYGTASAPDLARMRTFAELLYETLDTEMDLHREYAERFGLTEKDLAETTPSPTTQAYTDFLVRTAATGTFGDLVAALLPCMWGFNETGRRLDAQGRPDHDGYAEWVGTYAGEDFTELTDWCLTLMDDVAAGRPERDLRRFRRLFVTSMRYEYRFWDAAWRQETWVR